MSAVTTAPGGLALASVLLRRGLTPMTLRLFGEGSVLLSRVLVRVGWMVTSFPVRVLHTRAGDAEITK